MVNERSGQFGRRLLIGLLTLAAAAWTQAGLAEHIRVVTHDSRVPSALTPEVLRAAFTMRLREWPDGTPIRVFVLPDNDPVHQEFCRELLGTYPYVLRGIWNRLVFTGTGFEPAVVRSEAEMLERVKHTQGAIGYLSRDGAVKDPQPVRVRSAAPEPSHE